MKAIIRNTLEFIIGAAIAALFAVLAFNISTVNATQYSSNVAANVNVGNVIYISITPSTNSLGNVYPNSLYSPNTLFVDTDNGGNLPANILIEDITGNGLTYGANSLGVSNTLWSATSGGSGTALTNSLVDTKIQIPQPSLASPSTSNNIYIGANIPGGAPAGVYTETLTFQSNDIAIGVNSVLATATFTANVQPYCTISISPNSISFGSIYAGANVPTNAPVEDIDNGGNVAANVLVSGTSWNGPTTFGVSNTLWSATSNSLYVGTPLSSSPTSTGITVSAPSLGNPSTNSNIYFGLGIPGGTPAGSYTQTITIENSC